jgi:hypothetical protein
MKMKSYIEQGGSGGGTFAFFWNVPGYNLEWNRHCTSTVFELFSPVCADK